MSEDSVHGISLFVLFAIYGWLDIIVRAGGLGQSLGMTDKKMAAGDCSIVETAHKGILGSLVKIDHHISAEDQIEFLFKLNLIHKVKGTEDDVLLNGGSYRVLALISPDEIFLLPCRRKGGQAFLTVGG